MCAVTRCLDTCLSNTRSSCCLGCREAQYQPHPVKVRSHELRRIGAATSGINPRWRVCEHTLRAHWDSIGREIRFFKATKRIYLQFFASVGLKVAILQWKIGARIGAQPSREYATMISSSLAVLLASCLASAFAQSTTCGVEGYKPCDGACPLRNHKLVSNFVSPTFLPPSTVRRFVYGIGSTSTCCLPILAYV